jgi:hypothetical protein
MFSSVISSRKAIVCMASNDKPKNKTFEKSKKVFNDFHKKRNETFKLNSNDFVRVSQNEISEVDAFLKELDVFHKEQFEEIKKHVNDGLSSIKKNAEKKRKHKNDVSSDEEEEDVVDVEVSDENIFLKKD